MHQSSYEESTHSEHQYLEKLLSRRNNYTQYHFPTLSEIFRTYMGENFLAKFSPFGISKLSKCEITEESNEVVLYFWRPHYRNNNWQQEFELVY